MEEELKKKGYILDVNEGEIENVNITLDLFNRIKLMEFSAFFFGWTGIGAAMVHYEFEYYLDTSDDLEEGETFYWLSGGD